MGLLGARMDGAFCIQAFHRSKHGERVYSTKYGYAPGDQLDGSAQLEKSPKAILLADVLGSDNKRKKQSP